MNHAFSDAIAFFPGCSDQVVWMYRDEYCMDLFLRFVCSDRWKIDITEVQCCQKEECTLQLQRIGQNIALEYFTILFYII